MKQYKRYSRAQKIKYWADVLDSSPTYYRTDLEDERYEYAHGFLRAANWGTIDPKFNELSDSRKMGNIAGYRCFVGHVKNIANKVREANEKANANRPRRGLWG